ncbi:MAG TPA: EamA family transporter [Candidatus Acidoferrales bacterium]|nr:EamA family transporter [Candidatus Acidoferrales bacterium]
MSLSRRFALLVPAALPLATLALFSAGQTQSPAEVRISSRSYQPQAARLRVQTNEVEVGVVVRDSKGHVVSGLTQRDFAIYDTISMNTFNNLAGAIFLLPLGIRQVARLDWGTVGWQGWAGLIYTALISSVIAYLIYFWALKHVAASRLAAYTYAETPIAAFLAVLLLGEKPTGALLSGAALILAGVYLAEFWRGIEEVPPDTAGA